jgi:CBS domain-containing protein
MRVFEVMSESVQTVPPTMTAGDAWELMRRLRFHHLLVKEGSELIGVISDRDLGSRGGGGLRAARRVADLMTRHVVTLTPTDTIRRAANVMRGRTIGCIPVTQGRRLVGIVTVSDLLGVLGRGADRPIHAARADLHYRVPHRKRARAW